MPYSKMRIFQVIVTPHNCPWEKLIQVLDCVGLWHYSRTIPDKEDYEIEYKKEYITVRCSRTRTKFTFYTQWQAVFRYTDDKGEVLNKDTIEANLTMAFDYVEKLMELELVILKL